MVVILTCSDFLVSVKLHGYCLFNWIPKINHLRIRQAMWNSQFLIGMHVQFCSVECLIQIKCILVTFFSLFSPALSGLFFFNVCIFCAIKKSIYLYIYFLCFLTCCLITCTMFAVVSIMVSWMLNWAHSIQFYFASLFFFDIVFVILYVYKIFG